MPIPTYATVISQIDAYIIANGNNEITANVLNPILKVITDFANNTIGDLDTLTTDNTNVVNAINSLKTAFDNLNNNGVQLRTGYNDPNITPPPVYNYADFYMELDISDDTPIQLWQWNGSEWTTYSSVYSKAEIDFLLENAIDHNNLLNKGTNTHAQIDTHIANTSNPHNVTKAQVGLSNVDNTSDLNKPISTATQTALDNKADLVGGFVPSSQLPSYVDDVIEVADFASLPLTGETGKIYVTLDDNNQYRWSGSVYVNMTESTIPSLQAVLDIGNQANTQIEIDTTAFSGADALVGINFNPTAGNGVSGYSNVGSGVRGESNSGVGVYGQSETGIAGFFLKNEIGVFDDIIVGSYQGTDVFKVKYTGDVNANSFIKTGGTSSQFLKADGSVDSNTYLTGTSGWSLLGNSGTNPATNFIGTTDAQDFVIRTNNLERVRINTTGDNTEGFLSVAYKNGEPQISLKRADGLDRGWLNFNATNQLIIANTGGGGDIYLQGNITGFPAIGGLFIEGSNNHVGIGNITPSYFLSLNGNSDRTIGLERHTTTNSQGGTLVLMSGGANIGATNKNGGSLNLYTGISTGTGSANINFYTTPAGASGTADNGQVLRATILGNGNFGVNTNAPTKTLDINGELRIRTLPTGLSTENILVVNGSGDVRTINPNSRFIDKQIPTGLINGANTIFTLTNTPVAGSEHVYRNGLLQESGAGNDYTISGATITFATAPLTGDKIRVTYRI